MSANKFDRSHELRTEDLHKVLLRSWKVDVSNRALHSCYFTFITVRWSNFDPRDPKMGVFFQSTEATPCGLLLK